MISGSLALHCCGNGVANFTQRWQYAEKGERSAIDDFHAIDVHRQLAIVALDENGFNTQLLP
jgi:hypothetical protein